MGISIAGAVAFDQIARTETPLRTQSDTPAQLNVKLTSLDETVGGCGANIAYNLAQFDSAHQLISYVGDQDNAKLLHHCQQHSINTDALLTLAQAPSARAIIITDKQGHQFTGFYPGTQPTLQQWREHLAASLMLPRDQEALSNASDTVFATTSFIQAPLPADLTLAGLTQARQFAPDARRVWVPGQYAEIFSRDEVADVLPHCQLLIGNTHELDLINAHGLDLQNITTVTTAGAKPVKVHFCDGGHASYPIKPVASQVDPTGCGDSFVAVLVSVLDPTSISQPSSAFDGAIYSACSAAARCLTYQGAQTHTLR